VPVLDLTLDPIVVIVAPSGAPEIDGVRRERGGAASSSIPGEGLEPSRPFGAIELKSIVSSQFHHPGEASVAP
jgi:hypothetical protein